MQIREDFRTLLQAFFICDDRHLARGKRDAIIDVFERGMIAALRFSFGFPDPAVTKLKVDRSR
jgi:hypothetical protein